ncbi:MAG: class I SAM-dependent methyltransferase [Kiritimatiellae bacterium]|nr:class I SAM-dependent methyltransferase [Kiritimatiellia bacterium]
MSARTTTARGPVSAPPAKRCSSLTRALVCRLSRIRNPSETSKARPALARFCVGDGVDIGFGGDPIVPNAICIDLPEAYAHAGSQPQHLHGDAATLTWFADGVLDFVYSSHTLEDFADPRPVLQEWLRVLKTGGHLVLFLPDEKLYREHCRRRGVPPNPQHKNPDFDIGYVRALLAACGGTRIVHERSPSHEYSFEIVAQKSPA